MTDETEQAAATAAAETTAAPNRAPETTQQPPAGQAAAPAEGDEDDEGSEEGAAKRSRSAERREARRRQNEARDAELAFYRQQNAARSDSLSLEDRIGPPPNPAHFRDQASYAAELAAYNVAKRGAASAMAAERKQREGYDAARLQAREARGEELTAVARETLPDYDRTVQRIAHITVPPAAADAIAESDLRPQLLYHLGKNPALAAELSQMTPTQAVKKIGSLEAQLSAAPAVRTATQAPPPATALRGGAAGPARPLAEMDMTEYVAARKAGSGNRAA